MPSSFGKLRYSRRMICAGMIGMAVAPPPLHAATDVLVYKDPNCGCCGDWAKQVGDAGVSVQIEEASDLSAIRSRLGVPPDLAGCHTAEVGGYVIEGHVPVDAVSRLLSERPDAVGISAPGMPQGSPGMSGKLEKYSVILFGPRGRRTFMQFVGSEEAG
ncbi:metal-binding protein [Bradyrhizobium sp. CCBAU 11357]|nr:metal-binding protein [Bradyrhizobium sp. CCBAU 11357]